MRPNIDHAGYDQAWRNIEHNTWCIDVNDFKTLELSMV